jgi:hypothetical protein
MNSKQQGVPVVIPPALDVDETELAARNEFLEYKDLMSEEGLDEFTSDGEESDEIVLNETDSALGTLADEREAKSARRAKRRKSLMFFGIFGTGFAVFVLFVSWAFGFGFFAAPSRIAVDRNQKTSSTNSTDGATSGDEKLKTALALVANENGDKDAPAISDASTNPNAATEQDLKLTSRDKTGGLPNNETPTNMIVLPDETRSVQSNGAQNQIRGSQPISQSIKNTQPNFLNGEVVPTNSILQPKANNNGGATLSDKSEGGIARSIFFGGVFDKNNQARQNSSTNPSNFSSRSISTNQNVNVPSFGTLLPVRFLGAVYTLQRGAGGLVRMELSRAVKKGEFSYPAGTIIVGRLRGSEYNRAFISAIGAIDPKTGKLVKFEGDILGVDGASGALGTRKSIKSWGARFLSGLREVGGQAVNILATRGNGRGGTIVLNGSGGLGGEMSRVVRGDTQENSFVMVRAGTEAYVLITDLPAERRDGNDDFEKLANSNDQIPGLNLTEPEMAEVLATDDPNKLRAALLKMSPELRALAIKAIEEGK